MISTLPNPGSHLNAPAPGPFGMVQDVAFVGQLMESLSVPVFVLDTRSRVMIWNRACEHLTGVPAVIINGKFATDATKAKGYANVARVTDYLSKIELSEIAK